MDVPGEMTDLQRAVLADLQRWELAGTSLGEAALDLARALAADDLRPAARAMLHAQLNKSLSDLRKLAPVESVDDEINEIEQQRERRRRAAGMA